MITTQPPQIMDNRMPALMVTILIFTVCSDSFGGGGGEEHESPNSKLKGIISLNNLV